MTQKEKLWQKFQNNPTGITYFELTKILRWCGCTLIWGKGSHILVRHNDNGILTIPVHNQECKSFYKKKTKKVLEQYHLSPR